jgi:ATP-dependent helicase YprA (DUF1998 family)
MERCETYQRQVPPCFIDAENEVLLMMHDFLANNRGDLIERCRAKVATRPARRATPQQLHNGIPLFLERLAWTQPSV